MALCVEPGADQVIGLLGILRAGAVPVPWTPAGHGSPGGGGSTGTGSRCASRSPGYWTG
ncbi:hypothetical protein NKH77_07475 [Streptomyces sp. M19]